MNLLEAFDAAGVDYHHGANENEVWLCCPFCLEEGETSLDERFRLGVNLGNGKASCFNCGKRAGGGNWIFKELERVLQTGEITSNQEKKKKKPKVHVTLPEGFSEISVARAFNTKDHWLKKAYHYVKLRKISDRQIAEKKIGYTVIGKYHHRIIFPVYLGSKLKGFVGRDFIGDQIPPYKNSEGDKILYNYPTSQHKEAVLLEGVIDTLAVERAAKKLHIDSLGVLGDKITDEQVKMLEPYKRITLWFDPDMPGVKASLLAVKKIPRDKIVKIVLPRNYLHSGATDHDPDELEREVVTRRLLKAEVFTPVLQQKLKAWSAFDDE